AVRSFERRSVQGSGAVTCAAPKPSIVMSDQKNTFIAIALSALLLIGWQYFFAKPQMERAEQQKIELQKQQAQQQAQSGATPAQPGSAPQAPGSQSGAPSAPGAATQPATPQARAALIAAGKRVRIAS